MGVDGENFNKKSTIDITNELTLLLKEREFSREKSLSPPKFKRKLKRSMTPLALDKLETESNTSTKASPFKKFQNVVANLDTKKKKTALRKGDSFSMNDI